MKQAQISSIFPAAKHSQQLTQENTINLTAAMAVDTKSAKGDFSKKTIASTKQKLKMALKSSSGKNSSRKKTHNSILDSAAAGPARTILSKQPTTTQKKIVTEETLEATMGVGTMTAAADTLSLNSVGSQPIAAANTKPRGGAGEDSQMKAVVSATTTSSASLTK